jgi:hypothetical protein
VVKEKADDVVEAALVPQILASIISEVVFLSEEDKTETRSRDKQHRHNGRRESFFSNDSNPAVLILKTRVL